MNLRRVVSLTLFFVRSSKIRFVLLTLIAAVAMAVFLIVEELSNVSTQDLDQAISQAAGRTGTYGIQFSTALGMSTEELARAVSGVLGPYASEPLIVIEMWPSVARDCPPGKAMDAGPVYIVRGATGLSLERTVGDPLTPSTLACLGGQEIPSALLRRPTQSELSDWLGASAASGSAGQLGGPIVLDSAYERVMLLSSGEPQSYRFVVVTGRSADQSAEITRALSMRFGPQLGSYGMRADDVFHVDRQDAADAGIKRAAAGVRLVYGVIGWGILVLGALGLLVAEIIVVRDRSWFFGLSRALGGRGSHIAALIFVDVVLVLAAGTVLAVAIVSVLQPFAAAFAESAFQVPGVRFLRPAMVPQLIVGEFVVLMLAGAWPALKAVRQDPLDVLEPRST